MCDHRHAPASDQLLTTIAAGQQLHQTPHASDGEAAVRRCDVPHVRSEGKMLWCPTPSPLPCNSPTACSHASHETCCLMCWQPCVTRRASIRCRALTATKSPLNSSHPMRSFQAPIPNTDQTCSAFVAHCPSINAGEWISTCVHTHQACQARCCVCCLHSRSALAIRSRLYRDHTASTSQADSRWLSRRLRRTYVCPHQVGGSQRFHVAVNPCLGCNLTSLP